MNTVIIEINDNSLRASNASGQLIDSPGYALLDGKVIVGADARAQARLQPGRVYSHFWGDLSLAALPTRAGGVQTTADLAYHHLNRVWDELPEKADRVVFATPGSYTREQLSLLLGIARESNIPVSGVVDAALVAAETPAPGRQLMHLDLMSGWAVLTELGQGKRLRRTRVSNIDDAGLSAFHDCWANAIADSCVRNTRFDPMHSADSEQALYDRLPQWINEIGRDGSAEIALNGSGDLGLKINADTISTAAQSLYSKITRHIAASSKPGEALTLLLSDRLQAFPGLHHALTGNLQKSEIIDLATSATAAGALRRQAEILSGGDAVTFVSSVSWVRQNEALTPPSDARSERSDLPTHILYRGRAWPITEAPLHIGSHASNDASCIVLTGDLAGVSADHCRVFRRDGITCIEDSSQHGTFLNDRRINGQTPVCYGDIVRLGGSEQVAQLIKIS